MLMKYRVSRLRGFTLLEVMIALVVLSVGLLGIVKLESAAIASTTVAAKRSLAALEGDSLAAMMHVNRGYWSSPDASGGKIAITGTTVTVTAVAPNLTTSVAGTTACTMTATPYCSVTDMAAYDLKQWAAAVNMVLPNYIAVNVTQTSATTNPSYSLYVEP